MRKQEADDLIEHLITHDSVPRKLIVVSDDHRIQQAARRRQCTAMGCLDYLEELAKKRRQHRQQGKEIPEKAEAVSQKEMQNWLKEFADLENDPEVKELFDPFGFGEECSEP